MITLEIINNILEKENIQDSNVLEITNIGSRLLNKQNPGDMDYFITVNNLFEKSFRSHFKIKKESLDLFFGDYNLLKDRLELNKMKEFDKFNILYNYAYSPGIKNIVYGDSGLTFDFFGHKTKYIDIVKELYHSSIGRRPYSLGKYKLGKIFSHYYVIVKFYDNNTLEITTEMQSDLDRLYETPVDSSSKEEYRSIIEYIDSRMQM
jgi:hypothetical protein